MAYVVGALLALLGFILGIVFTAASVRRKILALSENPSNPIFKAMCDQVMKSFMPTFEAMAGIAEYHDIETHCLNRCGHSIASKIRASAMEFLSGPYPTQDPKEGPK